MSDHVLLSRLLFALTAGFHILWPVLSIGLSLFLVLLEALWLKTGDELYYRQLRFWTRLFVLNFTVGVVSGIPLEFEFGTNWAPFAVAGGNFFGHILGFEGTMAFMLEAGFLGIMLFGWARVSPRVHFFSTGMVALGATLSAFWIMVANSWMQTPAGGVWENGRFVVTSRLGAIFNPDFPWAFGHMWVACLEISLFVVGGVSAWYLLKKRHPEFFLKSFKVALMAAVFIAPLQVWLGDGSGRAVARYQPTKLGGLEAHWQTNPPGKGAPWKMLAWPDTARQENYFALEIPYGLSLLITHSFTGQVKGLKDFPPENQPPVALCFYAFRVMIAIGFALAGLMLWTLWVWRKGGLSVPGLGRRKWLLYAWIAAAPLSYLALEAGWVTREVGRQPWIIYGVLRTRDAAAALPPAAVAVSLVGFAAFYALLFLGFLIFARRLLLKGPDLKSPLPRSSAAGAAPGLGNPPAEGV
jgi:cytochrome d ubiquinol oxidase subunit I